MVGGQVHVELAVSRRRRAASRASTLVRSLTTSLLRTVETIRFWSTAADSPHRCPTE